MQTTFCRAPSSQALARQTVIIKESSVAYRRRATLGGPPARSLAHISRRHPLAPICGVILGFLLFGLLKNQPAYAVGEPCIGSYFVETQGTIVLEAEKFTGRMVGQGESASNEWFFINDYAGSSGFGAMQPLPILGTRALLEVTGPALHYAVEFQTPGIYAVFVRGASPTGSQTSDSVHVGVNGAPATNACGSGLTGFTPQLSWLGKSNGSAPTEILIPQAGRYTINVWMREDGFLFDKLILTQSPSANIENRAGQGPEASLCVGDTLTAPPFVLLPQAATVAPASANQSRFRQGFKTGTDDALASDGDDIRNGSSEGQKEWNLHSHQNNILNFLEGEAISQSLFLPLISASVNPEDVALRDIDQVTYIEMLSQIDVTPPTIYGASATVGEPLETCSSGDDPNLVIVSPADPWRTTIKGATPGQTILLRGGIYTSDYGLVIPAGAPGAPITLKPYNCEPVTIQGTIELGSHTVLAGVRVEVPHSLTNRTVLLVDSESRQNPVEDVIIRNNSIYGGTGDAVRLWNDVSNVTLLGNQIDGGQEGHAILILGQDTSIQPTRQPTDILLSNNRLSKRYYESPAEDMIQINHSGQVTILQNSCENGPRMEECIDIKSTSAPAIIRFNLFDGDTLHTAGRGEDGAIGCMVLHESDGTLSQHMVEYNYFNHCKGSSLRFATQDGQSASAIVRHNLFIQRDTESVLPIWHAENVRFVNNTMLGGKLKLGDSKQTKIPTGTVLSNNIFFGTEFIDNMTAPTHAYQCSHNLFFDVAGDKIAQERCIDSRESSPVFIFGPASELLLSDESLARGTGLCQQDLGASMVYSPESTDD